MVGGPREVADSGMNGPGSVIASRPREMADCGEGQARLQLASEAADGGPGDRPCNPEFQRGEIKPQTTD